MKPARTPAPLRTFCAGAATPIADMASETAPGPRIGAAGRGRDRARIRHRPGDRASAWLASFWPVKAGLCTCSLPLGRLWEACVR
jgi:hypothetical protein